MNEKEVKTALLLKKQDSLKKINERLINPMASDETIRELLKTKNELIGDIQTLEIQIDKLPFEGLHNELDGSEG